MCIPSKYLTSYVTIMVLKVFIGTPTTRLMILKNTLKVGFWAICAMIAFAFFGCSNTIYTYQNGQSYNEYEQVKNAQVTSVTKRPKVQSKTPSWTKYNSKNKYKRYY